MRHSLDRKLCGSFRINSHIPPYSIHVERSAFEERFGEDDVSAAGLDLTYLVLP